MLQHQNVSVTAGEVDAFLHPAADPALHADPHWQTWSALTEPGWQQVGEDGFVPDLPADARLLLPVSLWRARRAELVETGCPVGLLIHGGDDPALVQSDLDVFSLIVIASATQERRAEVARSLRADYGYAGLLAPLDAPRNDTAELRVEGFNALASRVPSPGRLKLAEQIALTRLQR